VCSDRPLSERARSENRLAHATRTGAMRVSKKWTKPIAEQRTGEGKETLKTTKKVEKSRSITPWTVENPNKGGTLFWGAPNWRRKPGGREAERDYLYLKRPPSKSVAELKIHGRLSARQKKIKRKGE